MGRTRPTFFGKTVLPGLVDGGLGAVLDREDVREVLARVAGVGRGRQVDFGADSEVLQVDQGQSVASFDQQRVVVGQREHFQDVRDQVLVDDRVVRESVELEPVVGVQQQQTLPVVHTKEVERADILHHPLATDGARGADSQAKQLAVFVFGDEVVFVRRDPEFADGVESVEGGIVFVLAGRRLA